MKANSATAPARKKTKLKDRHHPPLGPKGKPIRTKKVSSEFGTKTTDVKYIGLPVTMDIELERISNIIHSAFGSCGSDDWAVIEKAVRPKGKKPWEKDEYDEEQYEFPLYPGGSLVIGLTEHHEGDILGKKRWTLDMKAIQKGLQLLAQERPNTFLHMLTDENYDGPAADCFLQFCLFGQDMF